MTGPALMDRSSWPCQMGNAGYTNVSAAALRSQGEVRWSAALPDRDVGGLVVGHDGTCFVRSATQLTAVTPSGEIVWSTGTRRPLDLPVALPNGRLLCVEGLDRPAALVVRDQGTGEVVSARQFDGLVFAAPAPGGQVAALVLSAGGAVIQMLSEDGRERWARRWDAAIPQQPLVWDQGLALTDGVSLRAYDLEGELISIVDRDGFRDAGDAGATTTVLGGGAVARVPDGRFVAEFVGTRLYVVDATSRTIRPLECQVAVRTTFAIPEIPGRGHCVIAACPGREIRNGVWAWGVVACRLDGGVLWEHRLETKPLGVIADAGGTVLVWSSPDKEDWAKYRHWYELSRECLVHAIDPSGERRWTWMAPGPLTGSLAIGGEGEVYAAAEGRLWALG